jgi:thymidine phosphorylase
VERVEPRRLGRAIVELGGGRTKVEDTVDATVGFVVTCKPGDEVRAGEPIASVFARDSTGIAIGMAALGEAVAIGDSGELSPLVSHRITARGVEVLAEGR